MFKYYENESYKQWIVDERDGDIEYQIKIAHSNIIGKIICKFIHWIG